MSIMCFRKKITLLFILMVAAISCTQNEQKAQVLLISFDGFRYDYLSKAPTPNFDSLLAEGVSTEGMIPVFPTKTFPNHYSIVTGLYPEHTGLIANTIYDPEFEEWYRISDRSAVEDKKWYGGEPIWNTVEKQGLKSGTLFWVGSEAPIQSMRPTYWKPYDGDMLYEARIDTVVKWLSYPEGQDVDFATLYFELLDDAGHAYGTNSDSLKLAVGKADSLLGYLKERLRNEGRWDGLNVIILSDHGMVDLAAEKIIRLDELINMDDVERITWDPATMIQPKQGAVDRVYQALKDNESNYRVYRKEEIPEHYQIKNSRRVPQIIMVADMGYTILSESYLPRFLDGLPSGTHGYDNREKVMQAFFVAKGPAFKTGERIPPFQNIHVYELMAHILGIEPSPNDGSLDSVEVILK